MWNLFWGLYILAFGVACLIVAYALGWRSRHKKARCTEQITGTVIRFSNVRYNGVSLPVVEYHVNGTPYTAVGPKFKAGTSMTLSVPGAIPGLRTVSNLESRENLPDVHSTRLVYDPEGTQKNVTLHDLYPIGSQAVVFYDPKHPKCSFVERYAPIPQFLSFWMPLFFGVVLTLAALYVLIAQPIQM